MTLSFCKIYKKWQKDYISIQTLFYTRVASLGSQPEDLP